MERFGTEGSSMSIVMYPWLALGHMTAFLHLSNKLAEKGHRIVFLLPKKARAHLEPINLHPNLITFRTISIPHVHGLPLGAETNSDVPIFLTHLLAVAMDRTRPEVETVVRTVKPDLVFYDFADWVPGISAPVGAKTVCFDTASAASIALTLVPAAAREMADGAMLSGDELSRPPPGYPSSKVVLRAHEARTLGFLWKRFEGLVSFFEKKVSTLRNCDAIAIRTCREIEGKFCEFISSQYNRPVYLTGPVLPDTKPSDQAALEPRWADWLSKFEPGSVVYCAFGSQPVLDKLEQFQEVCLGLELTGLPFLIALKPPSGFSTVEEALPEGFEERVKGRGVVYGGWVQQPLILDHPSVGCFVSHCGFGSMWESLLRDCQIVLVPHLGEQILNAKLMSEEMEVAVEVKREENGWFSRHSLKDAVKSVMDKDSEIGEIVRKNHKKWKDVLGESGFSESYISKFEQSLLQLLIP
ncbi:PREDICTED: anthocyanidin 3-O-glucoside 2'''-O-xylosyltransferase [Tarenaya hassleriana]|uniref:anthocyanidin 3-O-glucoside 2'''-O-xylosyltransferase n=1 Tax=Tarenaya hassleriana TaxID=28532 RepID=UPI00053C30C2|nr:PREDICTED: anthocyanidin 3-O-glucoside 2'''-O-xylosyltransferase [Tarenaya hassleriana]